MKNLASHLSRKSTPQTDAIPGSNQQQNNAGGFSYVLDCWKRLERFLILGSDGGTYYVNERKLTQDNAKCVLECAQEDHARTVRTIVEVSDKGRAPKNDAAILALSILASSDDPFVRREALSALSKVCRISTHLFQFLAACKEQRGWGRGLREHVAMWYNTRTVENLAYQVTKYRNRCGYTHRDVLRLCHPVAMDSDRNRLYRWIVKQDDVGNMPESMRLICGFVGLNEATDVSPQNAANLIREYGMTLEHVPNYLLDSPLVWEALLENMPPMAVLRNLGKMTSVGLLKPLSAAVDKVCNIFRDAELLSKARLHPFSILVALKTYQSGSGVRGSLSWGPVSQIVKVLEDAFYMTFDFVEPTNKRVLIGLDVSGSMSCSIANTKITARDAAVCMSMVMYRTEPKTHIMAFGHTFVPFDISPNASLNEVTQKMCRIPFGATDCSLPMRYALENKLEVDTFVVYTDSETWSGPIHPSQALRQYRDKTGINAKLIVVGMTATEFTIADPDDPGMMDVVGFDTSCPAVMADFMKQ